MCKGLCGSRPECMRSIKESVGPRGLRIVGIEDRKVIEVGANCTVIWEAI